jgi:cation diffusion facilitator family transporter
VTRELKALVFSMIYNFIISIIKLFGGVFFHLGSLSADGLHTLSDFITDLISFLGVHLSKKRPTKHHPFGFGRVSYLTNLFIGMLLVILAIYIIISGFLNEVVVPDNSVFLLLFTVFVLKLIVLVFLYYASNHIRSQVLITSYREAKTDLVSTVIVFLVVLLLKFSEQYSFLEYADVIGSSVIGLMVLHMAIQIITENSLSLLGEAEVDSDLVRNIREFILSFKGVKDTKFTLIKYGDYYQIHVMLEVNEGLSLRQVSHLEQKLRENLVRHRSFHVKYPTIYVTNHLDK